MDLIPAPRQDIDTLVGEPPVFDDDTEQLAAVNEAAALLFVLGLKPDLTVDDVEAEVRGHYGYAGRLVEEVGGDVGMYCRHVDAIVTAARHAWAGAS